MDYTRFGSTGLKVSRICLGCLYGQMEAGHTGLLFLFHSHDWLEHHYPLYQRTVCLGPVEDFATNLDLVDPVGLDLVLGPLSLLWLYRNRHGLCFEYSACLSLAFAGIKSHYKY